MADSFQRVFAGTSSLNAVVERADEAILFIAVGVAGILHYRSPVSPRTDGVGGRESSRRQAVLQPLVIGAAAIVGVVPFRCLSPPGCSSNDMHVAIP
jgi:hypothetical protein